MTQRLKSPSHRSTPVARRRRTIFLVIAALFAVIVFSDALLKKAYAQKILPGVRLGDERLGSETPEKAMELVGERMTSLESEGIVLRFGDSDVLLEFTLADISGLGLTVDVLEYDIEASVKAAYEIGRHGAVLQGMFDRVRSALFGVQVHPRYTLSEENLLRALKSVLKKYERPAVEAGFALNGNGTVETTPSKDGEAFDYGLIARHVRDRVTTVSLEPIRIALVHDEPTVTVTDAEKILPAVRELVRAGMLSLHAGKETLTLKPSQYIGWLQPVRSSGAPELGINSEVVTAYLNDMLVKVNVPAKEPKFSLKKGKVSEFQASSPGSELDIEASVTEINKAISARTTEITLVMKTVQPQATEDRIANLGIVELIAQGKTNFSGSPVNRRHNIKVGADLLNGLLIKPGEEFSLVKAIGPVDATLGYRQELVIKEDRTIPEFGGGLCQIGTTFFRLVLNAGLPILERKNHSYRVRYYEPPVGMDATIYEPKPDFRFMNDYAKHLLLQTRIEGDDLIFEFWGTKDGRTVSLSTPRVYNVVPAPPQLTIETTDLKPGETKCTEKAHVGSDAEFTYSVTYSNGEKKEQVFKSHYKPWRAVCFVGVKEVKKPKDEKKENGEESNKNVNTNKSVNSNANSNVNAVKSTDQT